MYLTVVPQVSGNPKQPSIFQEQHGFLSLAGPASQWLGEHHSTEKRQLIGSKCWCYSCCWRAKRSHSCDTTWCTHHSSGTLKESLARPSGDRASWWSGAMQRQTYRTRNRSHSLTSPGLTVVTLHQFSRLECYGSISFSPHLRVLWRGSWCVSGDGV